MSDDQDITEQTSKARAIVDALLERDQAEWRNIQYRKHFNVDESGPKLKTLKDHRVDLDPKERKEVVRRGAVWDEGKPGVWKSVVNGKTWYVSNTHRAYRVKPTLRGAIQAFSYVKTTA